MPGIPRYLAAACQTDLPNPRDRHGIAAPGRSHAGHDRPGRLRLRSVRPRAAASSSRSSATPLRSTRPSRNCTTASPCRSPTSTPTATASKAREHGVYIQTASFLERDDRYPGHVFNTTCLIGPDGLLTRYRKVHPWIPWEVHASPHDLPGYAEPLFPVAETEIGRLGAAICYDWLFPEAIRAAGAAGGGGADPRVGVHGPVGRDAADGLVDARQSLPGAGEPGLRGGRQPGRRAEHYPPFTLARRQHGGGLRRPHSGQADPGPGEKIVVGADRPGGAARRARAAARASHAGSSPHGGVCAARRPIYPGGLAGQAPLSIAGNERATAMGKQRLSEAIGEEVSNL